VLCNKKQNKNKNVSWRGAIRFFSFEQFKFLCHNLCSFVPMCALLCLLCDYFVPSHHRGPLLCSFVLVCACLCSLFSDIKTCAGFVPVLCQAQKRHKMSFVQPLCSLFSDIKTCAGSVPVLCQAQKRHKMSLWPSYNVVLILCLFCASFVQPLCSLFSDRNSCASSVPVLCQAQKRHKMSCASWPWDGVKSIQRCG
jgi:ribosomal protein L36